MDVEEWFHAPGHPLGEDPAGWEALQPTLPAALEKSLELLDRLQVRGTFFALGWIAERYPSCVRQIADLGHEVACHGWFHRRVDRMEPGAFSEEMARSKALLESLSGQPVTGFRAPCWSIVSGAWAYEALARLGFRYSSSRLCIPGLGGGSPAPRTHFGVREFPALSGRILGVPVPAGGTVALRVLPRWWLKAARRRREASGSPAIYWFHPWELVADAPRLEGGALFRWARYAGLRALPKRLSELLPKGDRRLARLLEG